MNGVVCDMHVHTKFSCDSEAELESCCLSAVQKGVGILCITDHVDNNINDNGLGYYNAEAFFKEFYRVKEKYQSKLTLLCGIEFAEPHAYPERLSELSAMPYDFILGTVHFWYKDMFPSLMLRMEVSLETCYAHYWTEVLAAAKAGGFDCLGHIDFPKRFYYDLILDPDKINEICCELVRKNICMEINTSSLRRNVTESMPDKEILSIYKDCGGKYVTIGSDAHRASELAADFAHAYKLIDYFGLEEVTFVQRKPCSPLSRI